MDAREQRATITRPQRYLTRMIVFLVVAAIVIAAFNEPIGRAFFQNPFLNGLILAILALGIIYIFRQVLMLYPEVRWIETYRRAEPGLSGAAQPGPLGADGDDVQRTPRAGLSSRRCPCAPSWTASFRGSMNPATFPDT